MQGRHEPLVSVELWESVRGVMVGRLVRKHRRITHDFTYSRGASQRKPAAADSRGGSVVSKVFGAERTRWRAEDRQATNYKRLISRLFAADESKPKCFRDRIDEQFRRGKHQATATAARPDCLMH